MTQTATAGETGAQAGSFWLFQHDNYGGSSKNFSGDDRYLNNTNWNGTSNRVDNGASSMKNQTGSDVVLYETNGCSGPTYFARPNSVDSDFSNNNFDNKASCVDFR
ncbi:hypothetical protein SUDANB15_00537 [Streptomyces sp. enrichment culture]|uniref:peptidase inhibitor family I36 protein n=1 Tax=Streptomyces sp. enrichment culture TaxID=1795815 RepID=UPI003F547946